MEYSPEVSPRSHVSGSLSSYVLAALVFLLPLFFIPSPVFPFQFSKSVLALAAVVIILIVFSIRTLRSGILRIEWSWLLSAVLLLPLLYLVSSLFSSVPALSFFGYQLDQDTFGFMALAAATAFVTVLAADSEERIFRTFLGLLGAAWVVLLFQAVQLIFGVPIHLGVFSSSIQNLLGKWNDVAIFAALIAAMALLSFEALSLSLAGVVILALTIVLSLFMLVVVNFPLAWYLLGAVAFAVLIFSFMRRFVSGEEGVSKGRGIASCITLAIVVFFLFFGSPSTALQTHFNVQALEVSPSIQGTLGVLESVYEKSPVFGSGPNTFSNDWLLVRPQSTLSTIFWATEFTAGFGHIPTALTTGGIAVGLGWLLLIIVFVYSAVRALLGVSGVGRSYFLLVLSALASLVLLAVHLFYVPSESLTLLLFVSLGLFIASFRGTRLSRSIAVHFSDSPRLGFVSVLAIAVMMVVSLVSLYAVGESYASSVQEGQAIVLSNSGDISGALAKAKQAAALSAQDRYYRDITNLDLASISGIVKSGKSDVTTQQAFQAALSDAISNAAAALALNPSFGNWMNRAAVYESAVPLSISGASDNAIAALEEARKKNPGTPEVDYQEASIKEFAKDDAGAKALAQAAIAKKADYTPAILLLAQISLNQGNLDEAISSLRSAIVFTPGDSTLLYELGLLELQAKDYQSAANALTQAISITPSYQNAQFFLGEADVFLGNTDAALAIFADLQSKNPDNQTLKDVIAKLQSGGNPFLGATQLPPETQVSGQ